MKFINFIVNLITIQQEPTTSKNQDVEGLNINNFPYHQQGINKDDGISERIISRLFILKNATHKKLA